jgi:hypothetical protein
MSANITVQTVATEQAAIGAAPHEADPGPNPKALKRCQYEWEFSRRPFISSPVIGIVKSRVSSRRV